MPSNKALFTIGVFTGILRVSDSAEVKLLLRRRVEERSILPGQSFKGNWELPGGGVMEQDEGVPYDYLLRELAREVHEEVGIDVSLHPSLSSFWPFSFKGPNGYDLALVTTTFLSDQPQLDADKFRWVSVKELNELAQGFVPAKRDPVTEGTGLLSGWGKRMHCMALSAFLAGTVPAAASQQAIDTLTEIQKTK